MTTFTETSAWQDFCAERELSAAELIARGFDFSVLRMTDRHGATVAVRVPHARFASDANDPDVDRRALLRQEYQVTRHLAGHGVPVARPRELFLSGDLDVLVSDYLPDDGAGIDGVALGALLARIHAVPPPEDGLVASEGGVPTGAVIVRRLARRWRELAALCPGLPAPPAADVLAGRLDPAQPKALVHLDVRAANLRCQGRRAPVLVDWANALIGDPALELARVAEFARMEDNGLELDGLLAGYGPRAAELLAAPAAAVYRLDAAVMLALVFMSEAPDPILGPQWTERAVELAGRLDVDGESILPRSRRRWETQPDEDERNG